MGSAGKSRQHAAGFVQAGRLAQYVLIEKHQGIGGHNQGRRIEARGDVVALGSGVLCDHGFGQTFEAFGYGTRDHVKRYAECGEKGFSAR